MINITKQFRACLLLGSVTNVPSRFYVSMVTGRSMSIQNVRYSPNSKAEEKDINTLIKQNSDKYLRMLSTIRNQSVSIIPSLTTSEAERHKFMSVFPDIVHDLRDAVTSYNSNDAANWFARALQYNVPKGKKNRGLLTVLTYKSLVNPKDITPESLRLAEILGWCVEMLQCFFIISDDVMDNSSTRRGQSCWHRLDDVGLIALNDALMIENSIYILLKKYFSHMHCYVELMELFHEITFITTCGQSLDLLNANKDVKLFDMDKYNTIVANKTAYYSFYLPFALAMHLAGIQDQAAFRLSKKILLEMGHFFQVQDDFLDCFGNPEVTGKIGTDIQDNKCSWLAVVCMQTANEDQKNIMVECYGKKDPEKAARVKELYIELGLPNTYAMFEKKSYNMIKDQIVQASFGVPHEIFLNILNKIYRRNV